MVLFSIIFSVYPTSGVKEVHLLNGTVLGRIEREGASVELTRRGLTYRGPYPFVLKTSNGILQFLNFEWLTGNGL